MIDEKKVVTLSIETVHEQSNKLSICLKDQTTSAIAQSYEQIYSRSRIEQNCSDMLDYLNLSSQNGGVPEADSKLHNSGNILCDEILPTKVKKDLQTTQADYLILEISSDLVHIFWELLVLNKVFLCQRFRMGRMVKTRESINKSASRITRPPLKMWILADPKNNLPSAANEGESLCSRYINFSNVIIPLLDPQISKSQLLENIRNFDIIHFAGHTENPSESIKNGWQLTDDALNVADIEKMAGGDALPAIVFSNSCQSVGSLSWEFKQSEFDLAAAFMLAGVRHYIGTFFDIIDEPGSHFAIHFYDHLLKGNAIGDAIHFARKKLIEEGDTTCFTSYLLYGDPTVSYFPTISIFPEDKKKSGETESTSIPEEIDDIKTQNVVIESTPEMEKKAQKPFGKQIQTKTKRANQKDEKFPSIAFGYISSVLIVILFIISAVWFFLPTKDQWTSRVSTLAVTYDDSLQTIRYDIVNFAIEMALQNHDRFILLERGKNFSEIVEEIERWERLPMDKKYCQPPALLPADIFVFFKLHENEVLITVCQTKTSKCPVYTIGHSTLGGILQQKDQLARNLIMKLDETFPIKGRISGVSDRYIDLNIGYRLGVRLNQTFEVLARATFLSVTAVSENDSQCVIISGQTELKTGWRVQHIINQEKMDNDFLSTQ
jgi:CHAT domain-containing protein